MKRLFKANQRRHPRVPIDYLIQYRPADAHHHEFSVCNIKDISADGLRFWSRKHLDKTSPLLIRILIRPETIVEIKAQIKYLRPVPGKKQVYSVGVHFLEFPKAHKEVFENFLFHLQLAFEK